MTWILSANSWMHTPAGYEIIDGVFHVTDWWAVILNPSFPYRLAHMGTAAFLSAAMGVAGAGFDLTDDAGSGGGPLLGAKDTSPRRRH
jgi:cytochrome bd-type quinol oxidase subunit 1